MHNSLNSDCVLHVRFEDLIYEYEETVKKIETFTGYSDHILKRKFFDPDVSINNTQIFNNPSYKSDIELIRKIEVALPEYLYDFANYKPLDSYKKAF